MTSIHTQARPLLCSSLSTLLSIALIGASLSSCLQAENTSTTNQHSTLPPPAQEPVQHEIPEPIAEGWTQLTLIANYAKTTLDTVAHFNTSRNACGKDAYGAVQSVELWSQMVQAINIAIQTPPRAEEDCTPVNPELDSNGYYKKSMDGTVEIKLIDGTKRQLFAQRGSDMCTTLQDPVASKNLLGVLNALVLIADQEDCPNGWGSALASNHGAR